MPTKMCIEEKQNTCGMVIINLFGPHIHKTRDAENFICQVRNTYKCYKNNVTFQFNK